MKNKSFNSFISNELEEFLDYRDSLGMKIKTLKYCLRTLDRYLSKTASTYENLTPFLFLKYRKNLQGEARTKNHLLSSARIFFDYMVRKESMVGNPLRDIPSFKENTHIPFIFSPEEVENILQTLQIRIRQDKKYFFNDIMIYTVILLIARCGLRISEPLKLKLNNYRKDEGSIYIEKTKFHKDRLIPVPKNTLNELNNYFAFRKILPVENNPYLFPGKGSNHILNSRIYKVFNQILIKTGLKRQKRIIDTMSFGATTPHSLRHSFAVNTLKKIKDRGGSQQHALPVLSSYMGHSKYRYTAVYLKVADAKHRNHLIDFSISKLKDL